MLDKLYTSYKKKQSVAVGLPAHEISRMVQLKSQVEKSITNQGKNHMLKLQERTSPRNLSPKRKGTRKMKKRTKKNGKHMDRERQEHEVQVNDEGIQHDIELHEDDEELQLDDAVKTLGTGTESGSEEKETNVLGKIYTPKSQSHSEPKKMGC